MKTIFIIAFILASSNSFGQWESTSGPMGAGDISSLAVNKNNLFAGTAKGGVFLSNNKGNNWSAKNNGFSNLGNVVALAISDTDIFAGVSSGDPTVFSTNDNAENWSNKGLSFTYLFSLAAKPSLLLAGTWYGVSISTDNGTSWKGSSGLPSNASVSTLAFDGTKIFCGVSSSSVGDIGVFRSSTNGKSWTTFNTGLNSTAVKKIVVIDTAIFAATNGGIFISNTKVSNWACCWSGDQQWRVYTPQLSLSKLRY